MEFLNTSDEHNNPISIKVNLDFFPQYCQKQGYIWNKMFRMAVSSKNSVLDFPNEIIILVSSFIMKITLGEYQYYLNTLNSKLKYLKMYSDKGNRLSFKYAQQKIMDILKSLESKIGRDIDTSGIRSYILSQMEEIDICPVKELEYNQFRINYNLLKTQKYAEQGNQRMANFFKKNTQELMVEFDSSKIKLLEKIQICEKKEKSFKDSEIYQSLQKAKKYSYLGDRISMNFYRKKLLELTDDSEIQINLLEIDDLLTVEREQQFLKKQMLKFLDYAEDKSKLKDQEAMERNLLKSQKYYYELLSLSIKPDFVEDTENRIKRINEIFNCPL